MNAATTKDLLHLRIEQADQKLLAVLAQVTESLFQHYQPEVVEDRDSETPTDYSKLLTPLTREEMTSELNTGMADYERGDYITAEDMAKQAASW